ncbi:hypothetical protein KC340_g7830 [Hortaea werneckii]|nr:hypothetical protein KC342_g2518 [Hortaea werneckii]KAI7104448.1 hypothetical protein KC339_g4538 [Hortaea werneckii]KAI7244580.1 hypothetical protein KC365_g1304 [Hortaea werneckii]KAI7319606.1 hypothetical protein KC340_g7830 [Hortaea werneckii]KAI7379253.1 hypothetical protein KC328_g13439 [Hortaea werneckii]
MDQHAALISAAKKAGVKHIWYTSLAFGGLGYQVRSAVQVDHVQTEALLKESDLTYTSIREGIYAEAFPVLLGWHPDTKELTLPADGEIAFTFRAETGEATERMMILGGHENQLVLLTAKETINARRIVDIINETTGRQVELDVISREEYLRETASEASAAEEFMVTLWDDIVDGQVSATHPLMEEILRRAPTPPREAIRQLLAERRDYTYP